MGQITRVKSRFPLRRCLAGRASKQVLKALLSYSLNWPALGGQRAPSRNSHGGFKPPSLVVSFEPPVFVISHSERLPTGIPDVSLQRLLFSPYVLLTWTERNRGQTPLKALCCSSVTVSAANFLFRLRDPGTSLFARGATVPPQCQWENINVAMKNGVYLSDSVGF